MCYYRVIMAPNLVLVSGDIGTLILRPYTDDPLGWVLRVTKDVHNYDYPLSKAPYHLKTKEYSETLAREQREEWKEQLATCSPDEEFEIFSLTKLIDHTELRTESQHEWLQACYEAGDDEPNLCEAYTHNVLWCWVALCYWANRVRGDFK
jgi:hypothetical protein